MKKNVLIIAGIVVILLAAGVGLFLLLSNKGPEPGKPQALSYIYQDEMYYPILNGQQNGEPFKSYHRSTNDDGSVGCVLTTSDELILFTLSGRKTIATDVSSFSIKDDGKFITYSTNDGVQLRYDVDSGAYSADTTTTAYINDSNELMLKADGEEQFIAVVEPYSDVIGLSKAEGHIHVQSRINGETVIFHYDLNGQRREILRTPNGQIFPQYGTLSHNLIAPIEGPSYIYTDCQTAVKVSDRWIEPVFPVNDRDEDSEGVLNRAYFTAEGEIWYIAADPSNPIVLVQNVKVARCDPSGRYVWYVKDNDLWRLDTKDGADAEKNAVKIAEDLMDLTVQLPYAIDYYDILDYDMRFSKDCTKFYYHREKDLYLVDAMNGGEMKLIAEDISGRSFMLENGILFYLQDTTLYSYWDGASAEVLTNVESISKADRYHLYAKQGDTYYITDGVSSFTLTLSPT